MPRYLLDTNIFIYLATERDQISEDVYDAISEPDALLYMSVESVREMVIGYYNKSFDIRQWKTAKAMIEAIEKQYYIKVLPLTDQIIKTFAEIKSDVAKGHKDPSDHVIISHAITEQMILVSSDTRFPHYVKHGLELLYNEK
ncbi:MAG: type II toxin-antitoxin system VapC family toxin [Bacteroidaceae bacterium]|nr:type II toxin-antitoxin system VapC family toxin [Bacteroidaceae bacterium]